MLEITIAVIIVAIALGLSWAATAGILWCIFQLFGLGGFTLKLATGIWLALTLLASFFRAGNPKD